jgi:hypothetical protein
MSGKLLQVHSPKPGVNLAPTFKVEVKVKAENII